MEGFLKNYKLRIKVLSPIHVGNGEKIGKKEYINLYRDHKVIIPDPVKVYMALCDKGLEEDYTRYMLHSNLEFGAWLKEKMIGKSEFQKWKRYEMDSGDAFFGGLSAKGVKPPKEIMSFNKDAYGMPYIPGSSLKGMIRTALLAYETTHNIKKYGYISEKIKNNARMKARREFCLSRETTELETAVFHTLNREEKKKSNAVNCCLSGLLVRDSIPISVENLTLCQKIDYTIERKERPMPILREALKPGTEIDFDISIDQTQCPYTIDDIMAALEEFQQYMYKYFYSRFGRGTDEKGTVWLGGGCGFLSKTVLYPVFGEEAVRITDAVFRNTLGKNYDVHKHNKDVSLKIAPHVCKCTRYDGRLYDMGLGKIEVL